MAIGATSTDWPGSWVLPALPAGQGVSALERLQGDRVAVGYTDGYVAVWDCAGGGAPLAGVNLRPDPLGVHLVQ